jgi:hypothetical protein
LVAGWPASADNAKATKAATGIVERRSEYEIHFMFTGD